MKNFAIELLVILALLAFQSCTSDEEETDSSEQILLLDLQDTDLLTTRSRPLHSTACQGSERVNEVRLLLFGQTAPGNTYEYLRMLPPLSHWHTTSQGYGYGRRQQLRLTGNQRIGATPEEAAYTSFQLFAVGQDERELPHSNAFTFTLNEGKGKYVGQMTTGSWTKGSPWNHSTTPGTGFLLSEAVDDTSPSPAGPVGEIFSGVSTPLTLNPQGGIHATVLLKRQVAGLLGYFEKIPAYAVSPVQAGSYLPVTHLRLVGSQRNTRLNLTTSLEVQQDDAQQTVPNTAPAANVVNGFENAQADARFGTGTEEASALNGYSYYTLDLRRWFRTADGADASQPNQAYWHTDALLNASAAGNYTSLLLGNVRGWHNGIDPSNSKVRVKDGAVLAGQFILPFAALEAHPTFELQLLNVTTTATTVLRTWKVRLDALSQTTTDQGTRYNVYRNHLYQIGKRGNGDRPENPGSGEDRPEPLDQAREIVIKINDKWEMIHDLIIE